MARRGRAFRILIVDDSPVVRRAHRSALMGAGIINITEAAGGRAALASLSRGRPDMMLVDWKLREMNSVELIRRVRKMDPSLPVIYLTGEAERRQAKAAMKAGAIACLAKPLSAEAICGKLSAAHRCDR